MQRPYFATRRNFGQKFNYFTQFLRLLANSIASLSNPLGIMLAAVLAPIIVSGPADLKWAQVYFGIPSVLAAAMSFFVKSEGIFQSETELGIKERLTYLFKT